MFFHYLRRHLLLLFKGMAMGAADVVPGVSGGTIAFITGIYEELVDSIRRVDLSAVRILFKEGIGTCWSHINGNFLLTLVCGILISLLSLARLIEYCLAHYPIGLWSFFFGLVSASTIHLGKQLGGWNWRVVLAVVVGTLCSLAIAALKPAELPNIWWMFSVAGAIAICAMILPGISGSYILVLLGMYSVFLQAISELKWGMLASFGGGCVIGLMSFSRLLSWLLKRYHQGTLATLTGFLLGSLTLIWPWKHTLSTYLDRHGVVQPLDQDNVMPWQYAELTGADPQVFASLSMFVLGVILVLGLERFGKTR